MMLQCIQQTFNTHNTKYELLIVSSAIMSAYNIHFNSFTKWCSWKGRVIIIIFLEESINSECPNSPLHNKHKDKCALILDSWYTATAGEQLQRTLVSEIMSALGWKGEG